MPSRRRPKPPPAPPLSDLERFARAVRDSEAADQRAKEAARQRKADAELARQEAADRKARLERARVAHQRAVELVKEATRTGKGGEAADLAWRKAKAELIELETGQAPSWARTEPAPAADDVGDDAGDVTADDDQLPTP